MDKQYYRPISREVTTKIYDDLGNCVHSETYTADPEHDSPMWVGTAVAPDADTASHTRPRTRYRKGHFVAEMEGVNDGDPHAVHRHGCRSCLQSRGRATRREKTEAGMSNDFELPSVESSLDVIADILANDTMSDGAFRDEAALRAMTALAARPFHLNTKQIAGWAFAFADDLLAERRRRNEQ